MYRMRGFTLMELVIVIIILGIIASIVVPKYIDLSSSAVDAVAKTNRGATLSAYSILIGQKKPKQTTEYPTVQEVRDTLQDSGVSAVTTGIRFLINNVPYFVHTYQDTGCSSPTTATTGAGSYIKCIGDVTT